MFAAQESLALMQPLQLSKTKPTSTAAYTSVSLDQTDSTIVAIQHTQITMEELLLLIPVKRIFNVVLALLLRLVYMMQTTTCWL